MRADGTPRAILLLLAAVAAFQLLHYYPQMPGNMVVHFGASGEPNGWSERLPFFLTFGATEAFVVGLGFALSAMLAKIPAPLVNIPNREYWFAPDRREATVSFLRTHILWLESATLLFLMAIAQITFMINLSSGEKRLSGDFWIVAIAFVSVVAWLATRIILRFKSKQERMDA